MRINNRKFRPSSAVGYGRAAAWRAVEWITRSGADRPPEVRRELLRCLPARAGMCAFSALCVLLSLLIPSASSNDAHGSLPVIAVLLIIATGAQIAAARRFTPDSRARIAAAVASGIGFYGVIGVISALFAGFNNVVFATVGISTATSFAFVSVFTKSGAPRVAFLQVLLVTVPFTVVSGTSVVPELRWVGLQEVMLVIGAFANIRANFRTSLSLIEAQYTNSFLATHDALTGLHNRHAFYEMLDRHRERNSAADVGDHILYLDLDGFKDVNDIFGHAAGDEVLRQFAQRLRDTVRATDVVARLGGDEFVILAPSLHPEAFAGFAQRLIECAARPFPIEGGREATIGVSVGAAHIEGRNVTAALRRADAMMYEVKRSGKNAIKFDRDHADNREASARGCAAETPIELSPVTARPLRHASVRMSS